MTETPAVAFTIRGFTVGRVKDLSGFARFHQEPEDYSAAALRFVETAGGQEVAARAEAIFGAIRKEYRFKRKEVTVVCEDGGASIRTPRFQVALNIEQDPETVANYRMVTEVAVNARGDEALTDPRFAAVFSPYCDTVVLRFPGRLDLEERIDHIEENGELADYLDYDSACTWFTLKLPTLVVNVTATEMVCRLPGERRLADLIEQTQAVLAKLGTTMGKAPPHPAGSSGTSGALQPPS